MSLDKFFESAYNVSSLKQKWRQHIGYGLLTIDYRLLAAAGSKAVQSRFKGGFVTLDS
jgi:hypothetical protein